MERKTMTAGWSLSHQTSHPGTGWGLQVQLSKQGCRQPAVCEESTRITAPPIFLSDTVSTSLSARLCTHVHTRMHTHRCKHTHTSTHVHTCTQVHTHTHVRIHTGVHTCTHVHTCTQVHTHTYMHTHSHILTHTHAHTFPSGP